MLITPVQPYNSLNNLVLQGQTGSGNIHAERSSKTQEIKPLVKKPPAIKARKFSPRPSNGSVTTAKKKLVLEQEKKQRTPATKPKNIDGHNEKLTEKKQILANVLKDYEQISKDKDILTAEIKNMKIYLSDIRSKLDQSLTVLNRNTALFAMKSGRANSVLFPKTGRAKKKSTKKRRSKAEKQDKTEESLTLSESFLTRESFLKNAMSALSGV